MTLYALTSRHVCGSAGTPLYTLARSRRVKIGEASDKQLGRLPFEQCYPDFPSRRTFVNLDVGLCELAAANQWTSRVYGLPPFGATAELNEANIRLTLINAEVVAYGAASGRLEGHIAALFYRYRSVAGFDYVSDFLIAPHGARHTLPGDSGTVWHLMPTKEEAELLRPIAVEWGGQAFAAPGDPHYTFALATSLSSICKQLDVEVVRGGDAGVQPFWGQTGHYDIASFACGQVKSKKLSKLLAANNRPHQLCTELARRERHCRCDYRGQEKRRLRAAGGRARHHLEEPAVQSQRRARYHAGAAWLDGARASDSLCGHRRAVAGQWEDAAADVPGSRC